MRLLPCLFAAIVMVSLGMAPAEGRALDREAIDPLQTLSDFKGYKYDYSLAPQGVYTFYYMLPQSSRFEERTESGEVRGNYAYVAPEGDEFKFKYEAGKKGFQVESNALPTAPEDTDEVKRAKEAFFEAYEKALAQAALEEGYGQKKGKALKGGESENEEEGDEEEGDEEEEEEEDEEEDEDEDEEESEEDDDEEESEEDDDEESSEESSEEDDDDDEESSEEDDDEESSEESDEEDEEEESDEDVRKALNVGRRLNPTRRKSSSYEIPNYIYKKINDVPRRRRLGPRTHNPNNILNYSRNPRTRRRNAQPQSQRIRRRITTRQASSP